MKHDDFAPGWGHTASQLDILRDMDAIYDVAQHAHGPYSPLGGVIGETESGRHNDLGRERLRQYVQWGWLARLSETYDPGGVDAELTAAGRQFVEEIRARRGNELMKRRAMRQAVAVWALNAFASLRTGAAHVIMDDFLDSPYSLWYGQQVGVNEYADATAWLERMGFAEGMHTDEAGLVAIRLTPQGEALIDAGQDLNDYVSASLNPQSASATSYVTHIVNSPGAAIAAGSPGAQQHTNVTITETVREQAEQYAALLERLLPEVNPQVDAQQVTANVRQAVESGDAGKVRAALTGAQLAFASAIGTDAGNTLWQGLHPLLRHFGMG